jgi:hypothetical protein
MTNREQPRGNLRPFGYLRTRATDDLARCIEEFGPLGDLTEQSILRATQGKFVYTTDADELTRILSEEKDESLKSAAVLLILVRREHAECFVEPLVRVAFADASQLVRGLALAGLADLFESSRSSDALTQRMASVMRRRFGIADSRLAAAIATEWLNGVVDLRRDTEYSKLRSKLEAARTKLLADADPEGIRMVPGGAMLLLRDPDPRRRQLGLDALPKSREPTEIAVEQCCHIMLHDPDPDVRILAIRCVAKHFKPAAGRSFQAALARIVADTEDRLEVRDVAYQALFEIKGLAVTKWPEVRRATEGFRFPDDVDWDLVHSWLLT